MSQNQRFSAFFDGETGTLHGHFIHTVLGQNVSVGDFACHGTRAMARGAMVLSIWYQTESGTMVPD